MKRKIVKEQYNDGDEIENYIFSLFKRKTTEEEIENLLKKEHRWAIQYHLSKDRHNLLSSFKFVKNSSLLEIGAGCGALTGLFLNKGLNVTAVELSKRRADIISKRFSENKNLTVLSGNINNKILEKKFDYVTLVGVLEYAGKYGEGVDPFLNMLKDSKKYLKNKGILIIAIENRFGLKYWRGAPEDHTNILFDSLEGYPNNQGIKTFGKRELINLLTNSGFKEKRISFYYPLPDYKFCYEIFSDEYLPSEDHPVSNGIYPSPHPIKSYHLFNEVLVSKELQKNRLFDNFANSFLLFIIND